MGSIKATHTAKGKELARLLNPYIGTTPEIVSICSLICRLATTHTAYAEAECNRELSASEQRKVEQIEARIHDLVAHLPRTDDGAIKAMFQGDPRGFTVKLRVPNQSQAGNTWGLGGDFGVGR